MNKKFIEWDMPLKEISEESAREKNIRLGHPASLHIWWARRPLASSRTTNFASLVDLPESPEEREEIKELIKDITPWEAVKNGNSEAIKKARKKVLEQYDEHPKVLDPFAGGGAIPLEALRLGCETFASDYNPVAVFIEKATLEWPQKYGVDIDIPIEDAFERELKNAGYTKTQIENIEEGTHKSLDDEETVGVNLLAHLVEKYANVFLEELKEEIGDVYFNNTSTLNAKDNVENTKKPIGFIWARTIPCQNPNCNVQIPLIKQFWLSKSKNKKIAYKPDYSEKQDEIEFRILEGEKLEKEIEEGFDPSEGFVKRGNAHCPVCNQVTKVKEVRELSREGKMKQRLVIIINKTNKGKSYKLAKKIDNKKFKKAENLLEEKINNKSGLENPLPNESIVDVKGRINIYRYGMTRWKDIFNSRQLLSLLSFIDIIKKNHPKIKKDCKKIIEEHSIQINQDGLSKAIVGYLAILVSKLAERNSTLCRWIPQNEAFGYTFSRQNLPMRWDYPENNPLFSTGGLKSSLKYILGHIKNVSWKEGNESFIRQDSAHSLSVKSNSMDAVFTDPPYYDYVPYSPLSDFYYVWLKRSMKDMFPDLFSTPVVPKKKEIIQASHLSDQMEEKDKKFFEDNLLKSLQEVYRVLKKNGIAIIVYAHKTTEGWETLLNSLVKANFVVTASWPINTERKGKLDWHQSAYLGSSIYMVCRKKKREEIGFWKDIKLKIKNKVENKLQKFWDKGVVGGDFFISAIGPGMEIYSKYEKIEKYSGEEVTTTDLLEYIRSITTDYVVDTLLKEASPTEVDSASQFYLAYRWTYLDNKVEFDDARRIASGMGVELDNFSGDDGFVKQARKYTSVLGPQDREEVERIDNMVDVMHKAVLLWDEGKQDEIKELLSRTGYGEKPAFWQFCQAVAETLLNGSKEKQLLEGFLMGRDKYSKSDKDDEQTGLDQYGVN